MSGVECGWVGEDPRPADQEGTKVHGNLILSDRALLRTLALDSIREGLETGQASEPDLASLPPSVQELGATFVTLQLHGRLRGCVGSFERSRPLAEDVARNAYSAAFRDYRFSPLSAAELSDIEIHISVLTPLEPMNVGSREDLLRQLRPGLDGLLLEDTTHRATFLPQVWESLPEPESFLGELLAKAGLPRDFWSGTLSFHRYGVEEF